MNLPFLSKLFFHGKMRQLPFPDVSGLRNP